MSSNYLRRCRISFPSARAGSSTALGNLAKIIGIINTVPPIPSSSQTVSALGDAVARPDTPPRLLQSEVAVNLDLTLGLTVEIYPGSEVLTGKYDEGIPTEHSGVVNFASQADSGEASTVDDKFSSRKALSAENSISHPEFASSAAALEKSSEGECSAEVLPNTSRKEAGRIDGGAKDRQCKREESIGEGYLDLLLEAARQVSCANSSEDEEDNERASSPPLSFPSSRTRKTTSSSAPLRSKRRRTNIPPPAFNACEDMEPIVRSRRGRSQTLPLRYRDSVLEPWKRKTQNVLRR